MRWSSASQRSAGAGGDRSRLSSESRPRGGRIIASISIIAIYCEAMSAVRLAVDCGVRPSTFYDPVIGCLGVSDEIRWIKAVAALTQNDHRKRLGASRRGSGHRVRTALIW